MQHTLRILGWLAYPLLIYFGLQYMQPRYVALLLAGVLLLRRHNEMQRLMHSLPRLEQALLFVLLGLATLTIVTNSEPLLRFYPVTISAGMLALFALSLRKPPSMIERFARLQQPELPPAGVRYTRVVTQVWCVFLAGNTMAALYTALCASRDTWSLYNGLIVYLLMGTLLGGEWLLRKRCMKPQHP
jgi:uncharacterized membrane protein